MKKEKWKCRLDTDRNLIWSVNKSRCFSKLMALLSLEGYPDEQFNQEHEEIDGNFQAQSVLVLSHLCVSMQLT